MKRVTGISIFLVVLGVFAGCHRGDPAARMIKTVDAAPPDQRPPDWERTKALMSRRPPQVGAPAPDFTLKSLDGERAITLSEFEPGKPRVLIFGSYT